MKAKLTALFFLIMLAMVLHGYLTNHYYPLHYGISQEPASCNVGETFNCDAVAASPYSQFLGIPLSVFGFVTHLVLLILVLIWWLRLSDEPKVWLHSAFLLGGISFGSSLVMGLISVTQLSTYCLVCIVLYVLSLLIFALLYLLVEKPLRPFEQLLSQGRVALIMVALVPIGALLVHRSILQSYGGDKLQLMLGSLVEAWENSPTSNINDTAPSFQMGSSDQNAKMVIAEFADFRCGHCKDAAPSLHAFVKANEQNVQFRYFSFPLDGDCNSLIPRGDGISCLLSAAVICAEDRQKGRAMHDEIFANFETFSRSSQKSEVTKKLISLAEGLSVSDQDFEACLTSDDTRAKIKTQIELASKVGVQGTPTILVNGKKLNQGQRILVLEKVLKRIK